MSVKKNKKNKITKIKSVKISAKTRTKQSSFVSEVLISDFKHKNMVF